MSRRATAVGASVGVVIAAALAVAGIAYAQEDISDARDRADRARQDEQMLAGDIAAQSQRIDSMEVQVSGLRRELGSLEGRLERARARLRALERQLAQRTRELRLARRQFKVAQTRLSERVVEIYTSDDVDIVGVTLGADSLEDVIDQLDTRERMLAYDTRLVGETRTLREQVRRERERTAHLRRRQATETSNLARHAAERRAAFSSLLAQRNTLIDLRAARERSLAAVQVERGDWERQADALEAQSARLATAAAVAPVPSVQAPAASSAGFVWPVAGSVISPYGQRWGRLHAGIDIAAATGTPIVASAAGQVVYSGSMSGYGLVVVIEHGGGISTAYAHNSSNSVSVGQTVAQGQAIAAVGCTGHCFGDHVHFEVRVGGSPVDPMGYL